MRRLLRLSVEGFKTFARRTDLELGPGLTAVVGPNGSGKSNLIDAIAWAVGSRSWRSLRADGMEDVIFHGSEREPAATAAKVTLSFHNEDRLLGLDFSEVTIARELVRGGGGRVLVNGVEARLRDVETVISATGLAGGFSLIRQGMVEKLVLSSPEDVGRWIEESANLSAYRIRKQQAMERLRKVEAHAADAGRKASALRRELAQVRERAGAARIRRALEERRERLGNLLRAAERIELEAAIREIDRGLLSIRGALASLAASRTLAIQARRGVEEDLRSIGSAAKGKGSSRVPAGSVASSAGAIRGAAHQLEAAADRLEREGRRGWPAADDALSRVSGMIRELRRPGSEDPAARCAAGLEELRARTAEVERLDREQSEHAAELARRDCDRARLDDRLSALGPAGPDESTVDPAAPQALREELTQVLRD